MPNLKEMNDFEMSQLFNYQALSDDRRTLEFAMEKAFVSNGEMVIPGMEGIFSRIIGTINNMFQMFYNNYKNQIITWEAIFKNDWVLYCRRWIKLLQDNMPEPEYFQGTTCLRSTRQQMEGHKACLEAVLRLIDGLDKVIVSNDRSVLPRDIQNVIKYLETNKCVIDTQHPSKSKAGTRFAYGTMGRLGTAGYGGEPMIFVNTMARYLGAYAELYNRLANTAKVEQATKKMEQEINSLTAKMDGKANDRQKAEMTERINNIRARFMAVNGIIRAATDMYHTTLMTDFIIPLQCLGQAAGFKDDLISWIFATND